ncbi:DUF6770 family protein [Ferruginibacter sp.]
MRKPIIMAMAACLCVTFSMAQTRVFKQVAEEMSSDMEVIMQDGAVMGYVVLTKLEKANADSFNYKLSLMDENLNDIGEINQKDVNMSLMGVAFEQDVLCLSYLKSSIDGTTFKNKKEFKDAKDDTKDVITNQFITLDGKVINTHNFNISLAVDYAMGAKRKVVASAQLKNGGQVKNIPGKGFCFLYGDKDKSEVIAYNTKGEVLWKKEVDRYNHYSVITTDKVVYILGKNNSYSNPYGGYELDRFSVADGKKGTKYELVDKDDNVLRVLNFEKNPVTGKPYIAGSIINRRFKGAFESGKAYNKGMYKGVFSLTLNGVEKGDIKENYSYWSDGEFKPDFSTRGYMQDRKAFSILEAASQDSAGNVYFAGTTIHKKFRIGAVVSSTLLLPTFFFPIVIMGSVGTHKYRLGEGIIIKQTSKGSVFTDQELEKNKSRYYQARVPVVMYDSPTEYYNLYSPAAKSDVFIYRDDKSYNIYSLSKKQISRRIPYSIGKSRIRVTGAKEGHIMILENNTKEKYTKLSIEPI